MISGVSTVITVITVPGTVACSALLAAVRLVAAARHTAPPSAGRQ